VKGNHDLRPEVSLTDWLGMAVNEKAFVAVANAILLNSLLFLGEIAQLFTVSCSWSMTCFEGNARDRL